MVEDQERNMFTKQKYWDDKCDKIEVLMMDRNKNGCCANCNIKTDFLFDYKTDKDYEFTAKLCGCCLDRFKEIDKWSIE